MVKAQKKGICLMMRHEMKREERRRDAKKKKKKPARNVNIPQDIITRSAVKAFPTVEMIISSWRGDHSLFSQTF
jgi:acyl CoA:acetate/3-ketoacid CoA transferase beta subunit